MCENAVMMILQGVVTRCVKFTLVKSASLSRKWRRRHSNQSGMKRLH